MKFGYQMMEFNGIHALLLIKLHSIKKTRIHKLYLYTILQEHTSCLQIVNSDHVCVLRINVYGIPNCTYILLIFLMYTEIHEIIYVNYEDSSLHVTALHNIKNRNIRGYTY
jgi:hypothetical protein